jgi:integration host factor subunit alpha
MELSFNDIETPTLTKAELSELLFEQLGLNKREAKDFVDAFFESIASNVTQGKDVKISGFGNFKVNTKLARPGRNPRTGDPVTIAARRTVTFHCGQMFKDTLNAPEITID